MENVMKRSCEYDLARISLMLLLPVVHVVQYWGYVCGGADLMVHTDADIIDHLAHFADYYGAPCFMIMMGINMLFTRHNSPNDFLRRGLILLGVELVFNLVRYVLPALIGFAIGEYKPEVMEYAVYGIFNSDILAFAGLAFIVMAGIKKVKATPITVIATAAVMWIIGELITRFAAPWLNAHCSDQLLNILGNIVWVNEDSNFPLLTWMIYPAIGYVFISVIRNAETPSGTEKRWCYFGILGIGIACLEVMTTLSIGNSIYGTLNVNGAHHHLTPYLVMMSTGLSLFVLWICHLLAILIRKSAGLEKVVTALGSQLTPFYLIQWVIVGWGLFLTGGTGLWGCQKMTLRPTVCAIVVITLLSFIPGIVRIFRKEKK